MRLSKNKPRGVCHVWGCKNKKGNKKGYCNKHHNEHQRSNNPEGFHYSRLKQRAKRREKTFDLTLDEFKKFCKETGYIDKKGKSKHSASLDRIDPEKGYSYNNIQLLTVSQNSKKRWSDLKEGPKTIKEVLEYIKDNPGILYEQVKIDIEFPLDGDSSFKVNDRTLFRIKGSKKEILEKLFLDFI